MKCWDLEYNRVGAGEALNRGGAVLPRASQRRVLHRDAPHARHPAHRRARQRLPRLGHPHQGGDHGAGRASRHGALRRHAGGRAAGGDGIGRRDRADLGPGDRHRDVDSDAPQEGSALLSVPPGVVEKGRLKGREYVFATASADNIKKWKCPKVALDGGFEA